MQLETDRLIIRQVKEADFPYFKSYFGDETTARYVGGVKSEEEAWRLMAAYLGHWTMKGYGYMAIEEKASKTFIGCAGLWKSKPWPEIELGYWLRREAQGKGFVTEACKQILVFAKDVIALETCVSYINPRNERSKNVAKRLGGVYEDTIDLLQFGPHEVYRYKI